MEKGKGQMYSEIQQAITSLLSVCDGAYTHDGQGFNKIDAGFCRWLVSKSPDWSGASAYRAWEVLRKYKGQLAGMGIMYDAIPIPQKDAPRPQKKEPERKPLKIIWLTNGAFAISFPYDPLIVAQVRVIPGAKFDRQGKLWRAPLSIDSAEPVLRLAHDHGFELADSTGEDIVAYIDGLEKAKEASKATESTLLVEGVGGILRPFQSAGVAYASNRERCFIADEMGLGKTVQALCTIHYKKVYPALVVCPASLKWNWHKEARKWIPDRSIHVIEAGQNGGIRQGDVTIINYDLLRKHRDTLIARKFQAIILDESHYVKEKKAARTQAAKAIAENIPVRLALTGTPVLNRPVELCSQLDILGRLEEFGGWWKFVHRYCNPADAPIWMGDYSFKPLGDIKIGDEIIGWHRPTKQRKPTSKQKYTQRTLCKSIVLNIHKHKAKVIKVTLESGTTIRCTPDHKWLGTNKGRNGICYVSPKVGVNLCRTIDPTSPVGPSLLRTAAWLAGIYDGEGCGASIAQSPSHNPELYKKIGEALDAIGIKNTKISGAYDGFLITGGRQNLVNFLNITNPVRRQTNRLDKSILTGKFRTPDKIISIVPCGEEEVIGITTTTGNYIVWGYASKNCGAHRNRFGLDTSGATHLEELNDKLRSICYVRRSKKDVLPELPDKVRSVIEVDIDNRKEYDAAEGDTIGWLKGRAAQDAAFVASIAHLPEDAQVEAKRQRANEAGEKAARAEALVRIEALKQLAVKGKMTAIKEWVETFMESDQKLVIFAHHRSVQQELLRELEGAERIFAEDDPQDRQRNVDRFQELPDCRLIICSLQAGGVGITLTAASNVLFTELGWTPAGMEQAVDRCHRIGQKDSVTAYWMIGKETIDVEIAELLESKAKVVDAATNGAGAVAQESMLKELVDNLMRKGAK